MKILLILSPTYVLASILKNQFNRTKTIWFLNSFYLWFAILSSVALLIFQEYYPPIGAIILNDALPFYAIFIWSYFLLSRCNEIFYAFLSDAYDKMDESLEPNSKLSPKHRINLSLRSYIELIINFSILYLLLPASKEIWGTGQVPDSVAESIYFSGVTIATLGYGDISPAHWFPQLLTVYEVFCGFILLIVCFAIYAGRLKKP